MRFDAHTDLADSRARLLDAVADPVRLSIVFLLARGDRLNVGDIAARYPQMSRPAISHHLKVLKDAAIVRNEKVGQEVHYWLDSAQILEGLRALAAAIEECCRPARTD
jgi:DNA-binding transcriptional ArsR family regulator